MENLTSFNILNPNNKVSVIIINYKTSHLIQRLIDSISEAEVNVRILILDNASSPESFTDLQKINDDRVNILRSEENLGFTGGVNYVLNYLLRNLPEVKHFFLLNPDAYSCHNLIGDLMELMQYQKDVAAVSPRISFSNGDPWYCGGLINYSKGKIFSHLQIVNESDQKFYEVDVFSGCAALFDLDKVVKAGMFREDLFMYFDEADLAMRLNKLGYKILYSPVHQIVHDVSYTTRNISHLKSYYMTRNKFMVFNGTMNLYNKVYFIFYELAFHLKNGRIKNAFYHLKGFYDFLKGRKGACATL